MMADPTKFNPYPQQSMFPILSQSINQSIHQSNDIYRFQTSQSNTRPPSSQMVEFNQMYGIQSPSNRQGISLPINQSINRSINPTLTSLNPLHGQSINPSVNPLNGQSLNQTLTQLNGASLNQSINQSMNQQLNAALNQSMSQMNGQSMNQSINQLNGQNGNQWMPQMFDKKYESLMNPMNPAFNQSINHSLNATLNSLQSMYHNPANVNHSLMQQFSQSINHFDPNQFDFNQIARQFNQNQQIPNQINQSNFAPFQGISPMDLINLQNNLAMKSINQLINQSNPMNPMAVSVDQGAVNQSINQMNNIAFQNSLMPLSVQNLATVTPSVSQTTSNNTSNSSSSQLMQSVNQSNNQPMAPPPPPPSIESAVYQCTHPGCNQMLKSRFSLKRHNKKHTGERPHVCPFPSCHRKFSETTALKRHARIHTGEKPYRCGFPDCSKTFADATNVRRHEMTHTGEKPYRCLYSNCGRCFSRRSSLRTHMISLHNIRPDSPMIAASLRRDGDATQSFNEMLLLNGQADHRPASGTIKEEPGDSESGSETDSGYDRESAQQNGHGTHQPAYYQGHTLS